MDMVVSSNKKIPELFKRLQTRMRMRLNTYFVNNGDFINVLSEDELIELANKYLEKSKMDNEDWFRGSWRDLDRITSVSDAIRALQANEFEVLGF